MKNVKLALKLSVGFGLVLILTGIVAYTGYLGLQKTAHNSEMADAASQIIVHMLEARRNEKNFIISGYAVRAGETQNSVEKMDALMVEFNSQLTDVHDQLQVQADRDIITQIQTELGNYYSTFTQYVHLEDQKIAANDNMVKKGGDVLAVVDEMEADQQAKLKNELEAGASMTVINNRLSKVHDANSLVKLMLEARRNEKNFIIFGDTESVTQVQATINEMVTLLENLKERFQDVANNEQADTIIASIKEYETAFNSYVDAVQQQNENETALIETARTVQNEADNLRTLQKAKMAQAQTTAINQTGLVALLALLFGLITAVTLTRSITVPVGKLRRISEKIAQGDVNVTIDINQKDEIGQLADAFRRLTEYVQTMAIAAERLANSDLTVNVAPKSKQDVLGNAFAKMLGNLRQLVNQITDTARNVSAASIQLSAAADQSGQATGQITATIQQVTTGITQQTADMSRAMTTVDQLARALDGVAKGAQEQAMAVSKSVGITGQMTQAIQQVAENAQTGAAESAQATKAAHMGAKTIETTIAGMKSIQAKVGISTQKVEEMGRRSDQIGTILATIEDIASQTNLLALNAAIEAARAGEHGKGFAVVADEVRKLAEKSATATKEISGLIREIQQTVTEAVTAMKEGATEVETGVARADEAGQALNHILKAAEQVNQQVDAIAAAAQQMNASAQELVQSMETVSAVVEENTASAEEMAASSSEVSAVIENLSSVSQENSAAVEEVSAGAQEMHAQVEEVSASAQSLNEQAEGLTVLVAQFKLAENNDVNAQIELFKQSHLRWVKRLQDVVDGKVKLHQENIDTHTECVLGQWYYHRGQADLGHLPQFKAIEQPHMQMHQKVIDVVAAYNRGDIRTAKQGIFDVERLSHSIVATLNDLEKTVTQTASSPSKETLVTYFS
ncbi:MAG: hypothetical protein FOGNACKC_01528 [Anaerolineae bacterium]|nr:hypothetical protein [Anaerolineae bacterium]